MNDFKQQIMAARDERETGDANKALEMFLEIDKSQLEGTQLFDYLGELGLTYWHIKKYEEAKASFEGLLDSAKDTENKSYQSVALRHLSRAEFNGTKPERAVELAEQARELAADAGRQDLAWFDHGVVAALLFSKGAKDEIGKWFEIEAEDLYSISRGTKDDIAKWVWASGLLMDRARVYGTMSDLYLALMIAEHFNLRLRQEQITKLIEELKSA